MYVPLLGREPTQPPAEERVPGGRKAAAKNNLVMAGMMDEVIGLLMSLSDSEKCAGTGRGAGSVSVSVCGLSHAPNRQDCYLVTLGASVALVSVFVSTSFWEIVIVWVSVCLTTVP